MVLMTWRSFAEWFSGSQPSLRAKICAARRLLASKRCVSRRERMVNNLLTASFPAHVPYDWHAISPAINPLGFLVRESECTGRAMRPQRKRPERVERTGLLMV